MLALLVVFIAIGALIGGVMSDWIGRWLASTPSLTLLGPMLWFFLSASGVVRIPLLG